MSTIPRGPRNVLVPVSTVSAVTACSTDTVIAPNPANIGNGVRAVTGVGARTRYAWARAEPLHWQGRHAKHSTRAKAKAGDRSSGSSFFWEISILAVLARAWWIPSFSVGRVALAMLGPIYWDLRHPTAYMNTTATVFVRIRSLPGRRRRAENHVKLASAQPGDAALLRQALWPVLLREAAQAGVTIEREAASKALADTYVKELENIDVDGATDQDEPAKRGTVKITWARAG